LCPTPPISYSYTRELGEYTWSKIMVWVAEMAVKTAKGQSWLTKNTETIGRL
jgi:hypothetical protein